MNTSKNCARHHCLCFETFGSEKYSCPDYLQRTKEEPIAVDKEIQLKKSLFPLPSEWIEEFKTNWYKDNNALPKKLLNELWKENKRVCQMIYQYQRRAYEKNISESKPKKDISDKDLEELLAKQRAMCADAFWNNRFSFMDKITPKQCKEMMLYIENYDAPTLASSIPIIDKGENAIEFAEWILNNRYNWDWKIKRYIAAWNNYSEHTARDLYKIFKNQK